VCSRRSLHHQAPLSMATFSIWSKKNWESCAQLKWLHVTWMEFWQIHFRLKISRHLPHIISYYLLCWNSLTNEKLMYSLLKVKPIALGQWTVNFPYKWTSEVIHNNNMYYLWRKVVCFVLWLWDPPNWDASDCVLGVFGKL
jgi:hypothetical protein